MHNRLSLVALLLLHLTISFGQADTLMQYLEKQSRQYLNQPNAIQFAAASRQWPGVEKHFAFYDWYIRYVRFTYSSDTVLQIMKQAEQTFLAHKKIELAKVAWSLRFIFKMNYDQYDSVGDVMEDFEAHQTEAIQKGWEKQALEIRFLSGYKRFEFKEYGAGMELMLHAYEEIQKYGWSSPVIAGVLHQFIAVSFYKFGDMENCIRYLQAWQHLPLPVSSAAYDYQNLNTIGLCYSRMMKTDSAVYYLQRSMEYAAMQKDSFWVSLMNGNIGHILFQKGELDKAKPHLERDYQGSIRAHFMGSAANAATLLANIELQRGNVQQAETYIRFAKAHKDTFDLESMISYLANQYTFHKLKGEYTIAIAYADSLQRYEKRKALVMDNRILEQATMRVQIAKHEADVKLLKAARDRQILMRNSLMIILILSSVVAILWINHSVRRRRTAMEKLEQAQQDLHRYTRSLLEKNELIQAFREEVDRMKELGIPDIDSRTATIQTLMHTSILTEEDWRRFRELFDAVHPGFLVRLRDKFNDLTPAETRLLALTKLHIPVNDMADILGISPDSIRKTRYRLRKKINLPEEGTFDELVTLI